LPGGGQDGLGYAVVSFCPILDAESHAGGGPGRGPSARSGAAGDRHGGGQTGPDLWRPASPSRI